MRKTLQVAAMLSLTAAPALADGAGVVWAGSSGMAKRVLAGFSERMAEIAPGFEIEVNGELESTDAIGPVVAEYYEKYGAAVVLRSSGSTWLAANGADHPTFIGGGNYPPVLGVIENMDAPEGMITGVTYHLEPIIVLETLSALAPIDTFLIIGQTGHPGTAVDREGFAPACDEMFIDCTFVEVAGSADLADAIASHDGHTAIMVGNQSPLFDDAENFAAAVEAAGDAPIFGMSKAVAQRGGLAAIGADDTKLGAMLADRYVAVVRDGQSVGDTSVGTDPEPLLYLNTDAESRLGVSIPRQMRDAAVPISGS